MPVLVFILGVPTVVAIGTDLFQIIITGSVGTLIKALSNHVDLLMVVIMLAAASVGAQLGATATRYADAGRIRVLFGVTVLSGSVAVALKQVSLAGPDVEFLSTVASFILLGVAGTICLVIVAMLVAGRREKPALRRMQGQKTH